MEEDELATIRQAYSAVSGTTARILFLEEYLGAMHGLEPRTSAWVYEELAHLFSDRVVSGGYYKKAGFSWEREALLHDRKGWMARLYERYALKKAIFYYYEAVRQFDGTQYPSLSKAMRERISDIRSQLRHSYGGVSRAGIALATMTSFVFSSLLFSSQFTGLAIAEATPETSAWLGIGFFILGLFGVALIVVREAL